MRNSKLVTAIIGAALFSGPAFAQDEGAPVEPAAAMESAALPPATIDTDGDGVMDAWDQRGDGRADTWDTDGDGKPDAYDNDGDGKPDSV
ncbi:hypothetical protein KCG44_07890 [Pacificimonas sp. WHA3]|uniref:Uncharacterized protein n=1 Tax=Pacificimonas pallii TaxID=2827236 RepID=A0ABS6SEB1_9SPHN|nr:hypothetical protein [Pacificimonas pallii]MBV7256705.1 hypothetical protein [Pacificimonas pallii]